MSIYQTVYVSSASVEFGATELRSLLEKSRRKNSELGITGMLLFKDGNFLQVLEGERENVESLVQTIQRDDRHRGMIILTKQQQEHRDFESWAMAFPNLSDDCFLKEEGFQDLISLDFNDLKSEQQLPKAKRLVKIFSQNIR